MSTGTDHHLGRKRPRVFISYAHDSEGRRLATALRAELIERGVDVMSDHAMSMVNPISLQMWMDHEIQHRIVVCALSPGFLSGFHHEEEGEDTGCGTPRRGIRYEIRAILQKIYYHDGLTGGPVIPVAAFDFDVDRVPPTLRALDIPRFDPVTRAGADRLFQCVVALADAGGDGVTSTDNVTRPSAPDDRSFRHVIHDLEAVEPMSGAAIALVQECLTLAADPRHEADLPMAFGAVELVIKASGDIRLMRLFSAECLRVLRSACPRVRSDFEMEARVLICAEGWYLQRDHRLKDALRVTEDGVGLAERYEDSRTQAFGLKCLGRIRRVLAETSQGRDRVYYLGASAEALLDSKKLFAVIQGQQSREVGACESLYARTKLACHTLLGDKLALVESAEAADRALDLLPQDCGKEYFDLGILLAEIHAAKKRYQDGVSQVSQVIEQIASKHDARHSEILGRAYSVRADLLASRRGRKIEAMRDLRNAVKIFEALEQDHAVASCRWSMLKVDSGSITRLKITRADVLAVEELTPDARTRMRAVREAEKMDEQRTNSKQVNRKINWLCAVERAVR